MSKWAEQALKVWKLLHMPIYHVHMLSSESVGALSCSVCLAFAREVQQFRLSYEKLQNSVWNLSRKLHLPAAHESY